MSNDNVLSFKKTYKVGLNIFLEMQVPPNVKMNYVIQFLSGYLMKSIDNGHLKNKLKSEFNLDMLDHGLKFELVDDAETVDFFDDIELIDEDPPQNDD